MVEEGEVVAEGDETEMDMAAEEVVGDSTEAGVEASEVDETGRRVPHLRRNPRNLLPT